MHRARITTTVAYTSVIAIIFLVLGVVLGHMFWPTTIVVRPQTAANPAAESSVNLMIVYPDGVVRSWSTVSWNEAMSVMHLTQKVASVEGFSLTEDVHTEKERTVASMNNVANDPTTQSRWQYWVNNTKEPTIASKYFLKPGDIVVWVYGKE